MAALFDRLLLLTSEPGRIVYNGPMPEAFSYYAELGHPVPAYVNPADYYMDLVSPTFAGNAVETFVEHYATHTAPGVRSQVEAAAAAPGSTCLQIIEEGDAKIIALFGPLIMKSNSVFTAPFHLQLGAVFKRAVVLRLRDHTTLRADVGSTIFKSIIIGCAFFGIGDQTPLFQVAFIYLLLMAGVIGGLTQTSRLVHDREIMKLEVSDRLYSEKVFLITSVVISTAWTQALNIIFLLIAVAMSGLPFSFFGAILGWQMLVVLTTDSMFALAAAVASTAETVLLLAMPALFVIVIFNGFLVTRTSAAIWIFWVLYISPVCTSPILPEPRALPLRLLCVSSACLMTLSYTDGGRFFSSTTGCSRLRCRSSRMVWRRSSWRTAPT